MNLFFPLDNAYLYIALIITFSTGLVGGGEACEGNVLVCVPGPCQGVRQVRRQALQVLQDLPGHQGKS